MKKAVIFDLDGLLIDTESTCFKIYGDLVRKYGHELTLSAYTERYSGKALIDNVNQFIADFDMPITLEEGAEFYTSNEKVYFDRGIPLKPGAEELLKKLRARGVRIILATSSVRDRAVGVLRANGVDGYFDDMVFGPEVEHGKPAPGCFSKSTRESGGARGGLPRAGGQRGRSSCGVCRGDRRDMCAGYKSTVRGGAAHGMGRAAVAV